MEKNDKSAIVIFSGGLDSTTVLFYALEKGYSVDAVSYDYGQRHKVELDRAKKIIASLNKEVKHIIVPINTSLFSGSALTGNGVIPKDRKDISEKSIPPTYVPARNLVFLSIAAAYAESNKKRNIFIGVNAQDYSGYPDCREDFISSFENTVNLATKAGREGETISIQTPLINLSKKEIILLGSQLGVPFSLTWSCYDPVFIGEDQYKPCLHCDSCILRANGFKEAGVKEI